MRIIMIESKSDTTDDQNIFTEWKIEMSRKFIRRSIFGSKEIDFVFNQVVVNNDKTSVSIAKVICLSVGDGKKLLPLV